VHRVVISVGSNIDPEKHISAAREMIRREQRLISESRFVQTKPIGFFEQPDFSNGVFLIDTKMSRNELNKWLKGVENELGRVRTVNKYGPRTIDLDIVVWDGKIVNKDLIERDFLKTAVSEVLPEFEHKSHK
jgi:2-amino-4-hydroxy-6-hydroxymethyldihydropteridine diphosphokinase